MDRGAGFFDCGVRDRVVGGRLGYAAEPVLVIMTSGCNDGGFELCKVGAPHPKDIMPDPPFVAARGAQFLDRREPMEYREDVLPGADDFLHKDDLVAFPTPAPMITAHAFGMEIEEDVECPLQTP